MKKQHFAALSLVVSALLVSGCAGTKGSYSGNIEDDRVTEGSVSAGPGSAVGGATSPGFNETAPPVDDDRKDDTSLLQKRLVYFDYDKSVVREEALPILHAHAEFLRRNRGLGIVLGGHADERGSNEYNLALGQRRANAVRDILAADGVSSGQIEPLSFGEEQPRAQGQSEAAWQENRRVEIRYTDE